MTHVSSNVNQTTFRGRNDDGSQSLASWKDVANANWSQAVDQIFRIRFAIEETAGGSGNYGAHALEYSINGGAFALVTASTPVQFATSAFVADGAALSRQLVFGPSFLGGEFDSNGTINTSYSYAGNDMSEMEFGLLFDSAQLASNDLIQLRVQSVDSYTSVPTITALFAALPDAPTLIEPIDGASIISSNSNLFDWSAFSGDPLDTQEGFELQIRETKLTAAATLTDFFTAGIPASSDTTFISTSLTFWNTGDPGRYPNVHVSSNTNLIVYQMKAQVQGYDCSTNTLHTGFTVANSNATFSADLSTAWSHDASGVTYYDVVTGAQVDSSPNSFWNPLADGVLDAVLSGARNYCICELDPAFGETFTPAAHIGAYDLNNNWAEVAGFTPFNPADSGGFQLHSMTDDGLRAIAISGSVSNRRTDLIDPTSGRVTGLTGIGGKDRGLNAAQTGFWFLSSGGTLWSSAATTKLTLRSVTDLSILEDYIVTADFNRFNLTPTTIVEHIAGPETYYFMYASSTLAPGDECYIAKRIDSSNIHVLWRGFTKGMGFDGTNFMHFNLDDQGSDVWGIQKAFPGATWWYNGTVFEYSELATVTTAVDSSATIPSTAWPLKVKT